MVFAHRKALWASPALATLSSHLLSIAPRNARATALYQLLEAYYEDVKAIWEETIRKKIRLLERLRRHGCGSLL